MSQNVELNNLINLYEAYKTREASQDAKVNKLIILNNFLTKIVEQSIDQQDICEKYKAEQEDLLKELSMLGINIDN